MKYLVIFSTVILLIHGCAFYDIEKINAPEYLEKPEETISKVVFESGNYIQFDKGGGGYYNLKNCIAGITDNNKFIAIPTDKIVKVVTNSGTMPLNKFLETDTIGIQEIKARYDNTYRFKYLPDGGRYYKDEMKIISGFDTRSKFRQFGTDSISYLEINKFNSTKSYLANIGIASVVVAAIIYVIASSFKFGPLHLGSNY
jgi:hypothetical protein